MVGQPKQFQRVQSQRVAAATKIDLFQPAEGGVVECDQIEREADTIQP